MLSEAKHPVNNGLFALLRVTVSVKFGTIQINEQGELRVNS